jgi:hypothetical protein
VAPHFWEATEMSELFKTPFPGQAAQAAQATPKKMSVEEELALVEAELELLKKESGLPFLYGWKWYKWARTFFESRNKINLLCAANQISKSSTQIRKAIHWATAQELWPELWHEIVWKHQPLQFWYLYPTKAQVNAEFELKWKTFLPKEEYKDDPYYGWEVMRKSGDITGIKFNSGTHILFKTYEQDVMALQTGSCAALFCDEELPLELYEELMFRISATDGYFHMVFTATLGQDFWRRALEPEDGEEEVLPDALKLTVSLYEALEYDDGTRSPWTLERIKAIEARCSTQAEVEKRVFGKFIIVGGRKYEAFDIKRHKKPRHKIPLTWLIFEGVDLGSGKNEDRQAHKAAIVFVAVSPTYRRAKVFLGWRGDDVLTTAGDVFKKHEKMVSDNKLRVTQKWYDFANRDFGTIAERAQDPFEKAEKSHEIGEDTLNTLFKHDLIEIFDDDPELAKLCQELATLKKNANKRTAKDDMSDALRYAVAKVPWDWTVLSEKGDRPKVEETEETLTPMQREIHARRKAFEDGDEREQLRVQAEFDEINDALEGY